MRAENDLAEAIQGFSVDAKDRGGVEREVWRTGRSLQKHDGLADLTDVSLLPRLHHLIEN
jgi:hypothetical protein